MDVDKAGFGFALMTPGETAKVLDVSEHTLAAWRRDETGPNYLRLGKRLIRYPSPDVREFVKAGRVTNKERKHV
jgi:hypothetical protein